jgi:hypothetical protein
VRGNDHLDRLLSDPQIAADAAEDNTGAEERDRVHAMNLAMIRKAAQMTQVEVARKLGVGQGRYPGWRAASIVVIVHGHRGDRPRASW